MDEDDNDDSLNNLNSQLRKLKQNNKFMKN